MNQEALMTVDVTTEIVIGRPTGIVAAFAADPLNAPAWYQNITTATWETSPPLRTGSKLAFSARFLGRHLAYTYEIADFVPGERLVMRTAQGPFPMETTYTWQPSGDGSTRMTLRNRGEPAGFSRFAAPLMAAAIRHANRKDLRNLRAVLQAR
jgi:Polyketide cyclase / dehydrase and lipid transport